MQFKKSSHDSCAVICILLICYSSRGHQLVFSYPQLSQHEQLEIFKHPEFLANLLSPKIPLCDKQFKLAIDDLTFVGHASLLNADRPRLGLRFARNIQKAKISEASALLNHHHLTMFNLVIAVKTSQDDGYVNAIYENVLSKVASALKYEQIKRLFIVKEAEIILQIKEQALNLPNIPCIYLHSLIIDQESDLICQILEASSLARTLAHIYHALQFKASPHLTLNSSVNLSFIVPTLKANSNELQTHEYPSLRPYQTFLLLQEQQQTLEELPYGSTPLLIDFVKKSNPMKSFEEFQTILNCSLSQIYKLASHLVYWGKARIINTINLKNVYAISPRADLSIIPILCQKYVSKFSEFSLPRLLSTISIPRPLATLLPQNIDKNLILEMIFLLLQNDLISQIHMVFYLKGNSLDQNFLHAEDALYNIDVHESKHTDTPFIINTEHPSENDNQLIKSIMQKQSPTMSHLFLRILPYLNGNFDVEEIIFRESLTRKELKNVVKENIITSLHVR